MLVGLDGHRRRVIWGENLSRSSLFVGGVLDHKATYVGARVEIALWPLPVKLAIEKHQIKNGQLKTVNCGYNDT